MKVWSQKNLEDIRHEYIDIDGIKRYLVEIKDINKINMIKKQSIINHNPSVEKDDEDFGKDKIVM